MAMSINSDAVERYMKCPICMDWLKEAKILPCSHTCCGPCIWDMYQNRTNETNECPCPVCRQNFVLNYSGIDSLPNFFQASGILAESRHVDSTEIVCEGKHANPKLATANCRRCRQNICQKCVETHDQFEDLRSHEIVHFRDRVARCKEHLHFILDRFCQTCHKNICRQCEELNHVNHSVTECQSMTPLDIDELRGMKNQLAEMQVQMEYYEKSLGNKSIRLKEDKEKSKNEIKTLCKRMKSEVDNEEKNLVEQLDSEYQKENQRYTDEISEVRAQIAETKDLIGKIMPKLYNEPESPDTLNVNQLKKEFSRLSKNKLNDSTHEKFRELRFVTNHNTANTFCRDLGHVRLLVEENTSQHRSFQQGRKSDLPSPSRNSYQNTRETSPFEFLCGRGSPLTESPISVSASRSFSPTLSCTSTSSAVSPTTRRSTNRKTISTGRGKISGKVNNTVFVEYKDSEFLLLDSSQSCSCTLISDVTLVLEYA